MKKKLGKKPVAAPGLVPPKGYWQSPWQVYQAQRSTWSKIDLEEFDAEKFMNMKFNTYFNQERCIVMENDYDRLFHSDKSFDPRDKLKAIREGIFKEEKERTFPVVVSHTYGHRTTNLEGKTWVSHKRIDVISEMYRRYYINLKPSKKLPRGYTFPTV